MLESNEQYLFTALKIPNKVADGLATAQREIALALKQQDRKHKLLPRRMFVVPVFDLQRAPMHSDEAIVLACEQLRAGKAPVELELDRIACWPSETNAEQIVALLKDKDGHLGTLRNEVSTRLVELGFTTHTGTWQPLIPLIRLVPTDDDPALSVDLPVCESDRWTASSMSILGRPTDEQRARFQVRAKISLTTDDTDASGDTQSEDDIRDEIATVLRTRIEARRLRLSESKRSERAKARREEEPSMEPQPVNVQTDTDK